MRHVRRLVWVLAALGIAIGGATSCTTILGDDFEVVPGGGSGGSGGTSTGTSTGSGTGGHGGTASGSETGGGGTGGCQGTTADCDPGVPGCETDLSTSTAHCGACARACSDANVATASCEDGLCLSSCQQDWGNCLTPAASAPDDGCETPLTTADACGACGHSCEGGECIGADCQAFVVVGTAGTGSVRALALDQTSIFWTDRTLGRVSQAPLDGGTTNVLLSDVLQPTALAIDATDVLFAEGSMIARVAKGDHTRNNLVGSSDSDALAVLDGYVYYVQDTELMRNGTHTFNSPSSVAPANGRLTGIATDGTLIYYAAGTIIRFYNTSGGSADLLYTLSQAVGDLALDATHLYWTVTSSPGYVRRGPRAGGSATDLVTNATNPGKLAVSNGFVYYADTGANAVRRVPVGGGTIDTLVTTVEQPYAIAVTDTAVYFSSMTSGNIYKKALPP